MLATLNYRTHRSIKKKFFLNSKKFYESFNYSFFIYQFGIKYI